MHNWLSLLFNVKKTYNYHLFKKQNTHRNKNKPKIYIKNLKNKITPTQKLFFFEQEKKTKILKQKRQIQQQQHTAALNQSVQPAAKISTVSMQEERNIIIKYIYTHNIYIYTRERD